MLPGWNKYRCEGYSLTQLNIQNAFRMPGNYMAMMLLSAALILPWKWRYAATL
jgi:hypothetical protein